ncbi:MAG: hypothetical protein QOG43_1120 [Actinomycetota bacterium]|nr:hypothetical protein [Actinomycetota bacterium]
MLFCDGDPGAWLPTVVALGRAAPGVPVVVAGPDPDVLAPLVAAGATTVTASSLAAAVNQAWPAHVIAILAPVTLPDDPFTPALTIVDGDRRVATVGFLADVGDDDDRVTRRLRQTEPRQRPAPVPFATGPVVVLSRHAHSAVGALVDTGPAEAVADFSLRARRRGFLDVVDPSTQVTGLSTPPDRRWLVERHPFVAALLDDTAEPVGETPLAVVHATARAQGRGLRILVDGSWLGSWEMGTQVQAVAMVQALARRDDVERVTMALPAVLPAAARELLAGPKVDARSDTGGNLAGLGPADVVHRPFQPDWPLDIGAWRREAARTVVTILDLIAYTVGSYHPSGEHWVAHRRTIAQTVAAVDGVVVISDDVATQVRRERLPVESDRLFVVGLGTDHLQWDAPESPPAAVAGAPGMGRFVLVLGADYAHKNRDLAVRAHAEIVRRGLDIGLVLVGPSVLHGSSQVAEAAAAPAAAADRTVRLPNVPAAERNWLLRHAALVLYPTSAEGFGLVPHEAARLGTPTVMVPVGPLVDLAARLPVTAADWSPTALADAAEALLWDPTLATAQVQATLAAGRDLTWDATAARLVDVYRSLLARPAVR